MSAVSDGLFLPSLHQDDPLLPRRSVWGVLHEVGGEGRLDVMNAGQAAVPGSVPPNGVGRYGAADGLFEPRASHLRLLAATFRSLSDLGRSFANLWSGKINLTTGRVEPIALRLIGPLSLDANKRA
jgi:hypothetical protein